MMSYVPAFKSKKATADAAVAGVPSVTNIDFQITDPGMSGIQMMLKGQNWDDSITCTLVDIDGVVSPAGTVLNTSVTDGFINADVADQATLNKSDPSATVTGTYLRIAYKATGAVPVVLRINYLVYAWV